MLPLSFFLGPSDGYSSSAKRRPEPGMAGKSFLMCTNRVNQNGRSVRLRIDYKLVSVCSRFVLAHAPLHSDAARTWHRIEIRFGSNIVLKYHFMSDKFGGGGGGGWCCCCCCCCSSTYEALNGFLSASPCMICTNIVFAATFFSIIRTATANSRIEWSFCFGNSFILFPRFGTILFPLPPSHSINA